LCVDFPQLFRQFIVEAACRRFVRRKKCICSSVFASFDFCSVFFFFGSLYNWIVRQMYTR